MKLAYIILAHKYPDQLARLVARLQEDDARFFIHIDSKTDASVMGRFRTEMSPYQNVSFLRRHACYWGEKGQLWATVEGIKSIHAQAISYDYAIVLTGQCYPIKSNAQIKTALREARGRSFLSYSTEPFAKGPGSWLPRIERWHFRILGHHVALGPIKRKLPGGLTPYGGSAYWCFTKECVEYVATAVAQRPEILRFFQSVRLPEESFFQTVLMNSPLHDQMVNWNPHYIDWTEQRPHPKTLGSDDFPKLLESPKLFARKFDITIDTPVLDLIDQKILHAPVLQP